MLNPVWEYIPLVTNNINPIYTSFFLSGNLLYKEMIKKMASAFNEHVTPVDFSSDRHSNISLNQGRLFMAIFNIYVMCHAIFFLAGK